jgi:RNA polymerase sigma-70 factor (ECF subfamily)
MIAYANTTDNDLFALLKNGDNSAFRALFDRYYKYLVVTSNNILGDPDAARDLAQDVFFDCWKKRADIVLQSNLKAYLRRAVVNKTLNYIKARRLNFMEPERLPETPAAYDNAQVQLEHADLQQVVHAAIASLPERCRLVFTLCRLENFSHKEIAEQLEISTKTVENQMTRALAMLKEALAPYASMLAVAGLWFF